MKHANMFWRCKNGVGLLDCHAKFGGLRRWIHSCMPIYGDMAVLPVCSSSVMLMVSHFKASHFNHLKHCDGLYSPCLTCLTQTSCLSYVYIIKVRFLKLLLALYVCNHSLGVSTIMFKYACIYCFSLYTLRHCGIPSLVCSYDCHYIFILMNIYRPMLVVN